MAKTRILAAIAATGVTALAAPAIVFSDEPAASTVVIEDDPGDDVGRAPAASAPAVMAAVDRFGPSAARSDVADPATGPTGMAPPPAALVSGATARFAWFYKPPANASAAELAERFDVIVLTRNDESFRDQWIDYLIDRVLAHNTAAGWDGVFLDNVEMSLSKRRREGQIPAAHPTDQAWQDAMVGHVAVIHAAFAAVGRPVWANVIEGGQLVAEIDRLAPHLEGTMDESFGTGWDRRPRTGAAREQDLAAVEARTERVVPLRGLRHRLRRGLVERRVRPPARRPHRTPLPGRRHLGSRLRGRSSRGGSDPRDRDDLLNPPDAESWGTAPPIPGQLPSVRLGCGGLGLRCWSSEVVGVRRQR